MSRKVMFSVQLEPEQIAGVKQLAVDLGGGLTPSAVVRLALTAYLRQHAEGKNEPEKKEPGNKEQEKNADYYRKKQVF